jgi:hypothetical protein
MAMTDPFSESLNANGVAEGLGPQVFRDEPPDLSDPSGFVTELHANDTIFQAESIATIQVGRKQLKFKIRSVPKVELEKSMQAIKPKAVYLRDAHGKFVFENGRPVEDENHPTKTEWYLLFGYLQVLLGFAELTLHDRTGAIVWQRPGAQHNDVRAAIQALKDSGITTQHIEDLKKSIDALTQVHENDEAEHLLGN